MAAQPHFRAHEHRPLADRVALAVFVKGAGELPLKRMALSVAQ
jgi:hypothetical protein